MGDIAEIAFMLRAKQNGLTVLQPYSAITPYDLIIDNGKKLIKIQVKSTNTNIKGSTGNVNENGFKAQIGRGKSSKTKYQKKDVDFFAIYIVRTNAFYIIPFNAVKTVTLNLYIDKGNHKFSKYLENWNLLK